MTPPRAVTVDLDPPARALAVGAHPDDIEFGCGATLAKWAAAGCAIHHLVCTDGSKGSWDPDQDPAELVAVRRDEQRAAARALGGTADVTFLRWTDGELEAGLRQRWELAFHIRRVRPDVVLGHDPWRRYRLHPDHRAAGFLVTDGIVAARDPHFFPEQGVAPHRPSVLLLWEAEEPDHVEDASSTVEAKLAALLAHRSQFRSTMGITTAASPEDHAGNDEVAAFRRTVHDRLVEHGRLAALPLGEAFKRMDRL
ncbi:MAG TPA: PIG-L deacetylase family protein [Acidimicrobiales bacterium]|nr:PIG-L deacetylase family protein [Acidimicrobiales bacterium]